MNSAVELVLRWEQQWEWERVLQTGKMMVRVRVIE